MALGQKSPQVMKTSAFFSARGETVAPAPDPTSRTSIFCLEKSRFGVFTVKPRRIDVGVYESKFDA